MCARIGAASLARILNDWVIAPLHILPYRRSSLYILPYNSKTKTDIEKKPKNKQGFKFDFLLENVKKIHFWKNKF